MNTASDVAAAFRGVLDKARTRSGTVLTKGSDLFGEASEIVSGNVMAIVESGKILNAGLGEISLEMISATRASVETMAKDLRRLAAVQTPSEMIAAQTEIATRNLDNVADFAARQSDAARTLTKSAIAPITDRIAAAAGKFRGAAA